MNLIPFVAAIRRNSPNVRFTIAFSNSFRAPAPPKAVCGDEQLRPDAVLDLLISLERDRQLALVLVTHSQEVANRAGRLIRLRDGRVVEDRVVAPPPALRPVASIGNGER